jgi:hypothetical protein
MKRLIILGIAVAMLLCFTTMLQSAPQVGDTLKYRIAYYPTWAYDEINFWDIALGGLTHIVIFSNGNLSTTSPYWGPAIPGGGGAVDSVEMEFGFGSNHHLDSVTTISHRNGLKVLVCLQCVDGTQFDNVVADSTRTETFFKALKGWMIRKHIDGWDLDLESGNATNAQRLRFLRIGRRICYDAAFPSGRALIGIATGRGDEANWTASLCDTCVTFYDMQAYTYQWMWNGSANATWFQTPVGSPASCSGCEASSLKRDALYGGSAFIDGYVANGHDKSKFVIGYATECVTAFTGTDQLSVAWSNNYADNSLYIVEGMVSYGGTWTHDATAHSSYIHGTATSGNPYGFSSGTKFFIPFEDSTDMKAGCDYLKSVGAGGVMFYDLYGDRRLSATPNWKKTPYIYATSVYAKLLNGGLIPSPNPTIYVGALVSFGNVAINTISAEKTYSISAANLTPASGNITITAPLGFEVSKTPSTGFGSSLTYAYTSGTLVGTTIYVHFVPTTAGVYTGNITNAGGGATTQNVYVYGTGTSVSPTIYISANSHSFGNVTINTTSIEWTYSLSGSNLSPAAGNLTVTAPTGYQISLSTGTGFVSSLTCPYTTGTLAATTIYTHFVPTAVQGYSGNITNAGGGGSVQNVALTGSGVAVIPPVTTGRIYLPIRKP